jgi:hypothetical protein
MTKFKFNVAECRKLTLTAPAFSGVDVCSSRSSDACSHPGLSPNWCNVRDMRVLTEVITCYNSLNLLSKQAACHRYLGNFDHCQISMFHTVPHDSEGRFEPFRTCATKTVQHFVHADHDLPKLLRCLVTVPTSHCDIPGSTR